jgi:ligand-binding sensor domain-containing protein
MKLFSKNFQKRIAGQKIFRSRKFKGLAILFACSGLLLCLSAFHIKQQTQHTIESERARLANENEIAFEKVPHQPHFNEFVTFIQNKKNVRFVEKFQDSYFAATDAGLLKMTQDGKLLKHFTILDGLPESDLTSLAVFNSQLFIGTRENGIVVFDGENFASYHFIKHETQAITELFSDNQRLLIGTFAGGLIEFDGKKFHEIKAGSENKRIVGVNCINQFDSMLFVGTFADGLWVFENGIWKQFTTDNGLLSNRVAGIERIGNQLFIGTDLGVIQTSIEDLNKSEGEIFHQSVDVPSLSSLIKHGDQILLTKDDGEIFVLSGNSNRLTSESLNEITWKKSEDLKNARLFFNDNKIWFVGAGGIWQASAENSARILPSPFGEFGEKSMPTSNVISALTIDENSRLWVGNFRRGIDVFSNEGEKLAHIENETVKEINFLNAQQNFVLSATSKGAVSFDNSFKNAILTKENGLPSNSITHISFEKSDQKSKEIYATSKGVWTNEKGVTRGFSTVNGLPSNTISATLFARNSTFVGTLGGLAQIEKGKVVRVYKDSNSPLQNNWITALNLNDSRIFLGTYGGGIYEILPSGELRSFANETGKTFVNPNAIFSNEKNLFVGTLDGAWILDFDSQKWTHLTNDLPSKVVLSICGDTENIFFGTTNGIAKINKKYWLAV